MTLEKGFSPRRGAGFTMLEVLVAVAITGGAIVMLLQAHSASMKLYERCHEMVIAQHLARELVSEIEVSGYPGDVDEEGDVSEKYPGFKWRRTCKMVEENGPGVYEVTVLITGPVEKYMLITHLMEGAQ
jgi:prepilin-type N-terminal cleavage/methylation domain-containing protein